MNIKINNKGMTLFETINAVAIFSVIFVMTFGIFDSGNRLCLVSDANANNQFEIRRSLMNMERIIRGAKEFEIVSEEDLHGDGPVRSEIKFTIDDVYYWYFLEKAEKEVVGLNDVYNLYQWRREGEETNDQVIATDITSLEFSLDDENNLVKVIIDMTVQKATHRGTIVNFNLKHIATMRNSEDFSRSAEVI